MKSRQILIPMVMLATLWHTAAAQPKKETTQVDAPPLERVLSGSRMQSNAVLSDLIAPKPETLGPARRSQILRNRHEHRGRQDIGRFLCNRAGSTNQSN